MKRKKGQALVEFVIILPIFIFMLLTIIDIGKIIYYQNRLESELSDVVDLYQDQKSYEENEQNLALKESDLQLEIKNENNETVTFSLTKEITIVTPGLSLLFQNPYPLVVQRSVFYE